MAKALAVGAHVRVWWEDASFHSDGSGDSILKDPTYCETRGELVAINKKTIVVAHEGDGAETPNPNNNRQVSRIPMCLVFKVLVATGWSEVPGYGQLFDGEM